MKPKRDKEHFTIFRQHNNASEIAKVYLAERADDVVVLAEHHLSLEGTKRLLKFFGSVNWHATASPAMPTDRNEAGTTADVLVAAKNYLGNRHAAIAFDPERTLTRNAQPTGGILVLP